MALAGPAAGRQQRKAERGLSLASAKRGKRAAKSRKTPYIETEAFPSAARVKGQSTLTFSFLNVRTGALG